MPNDPFVDVSSLPALGPLRYPMCAIRRRLTPINAPGAVRVPLEKWDTAAKAADTGFANTAHWDKALSALRVAPEVTAVAYDGGGMTNAARVWFILQYYGLQAVILNGGWPVLASATGLPPAAAATSCGFRAVPGSGPVGLVDRETLRDQLDGRAHVFDTRTRAEFTGEDARNRPRSGHLPGARHLSHVDLLENGVVRPAPALRAMLERVGSGPGDHIVTHCEGGGRAALGAAAAVRAGFDDIRVYYLSFGDWVRDESSCTVEMSEATAAKIPGVRFQAIRHRAFPVRGEPKTLRRVPVANPGRAGRLTRAYRARLAVRVQTQTRGGEACDAKRSFCQCQQPVCTRPAAISRRARSGGV